MTDIGPKTYVLKGGAHDGLILRSISPIKSIAVDDNAYADMGDVDENGFVVLENAVVLGLSKLGKDPLGGDGKKLF
jgi:hypothetical protein